MGTLLNVEGRLVPPEQAVVPVMDRGFLYGDSVYEVVRTYGGRVFELGRHLARMERSAARIGLVLPPRERVESELFRTIEAAGNAESYARIVVTRGEGRFGLAPHLAEGLNRLIFIVKQLETPPPEQRTFACQNGPGAPRTIGQIKFYVGASSCPLYCLHCAPIVSRHPPRGIASTRAEKSKRGCSVGPGDLGR